MFGNGVIGPFLIIYLHNVRGISLGIAGLVVASNSAAGLVSGFVAGAIARTDHPSTFTFLFLLNAATFLVFVAVLRLVPAPRPVEAHHEPGRYVDVLRNGVFLRYIVLNVIFIGAGIAVMSELLPPFAKNVAHVSEPAIGVLWFVFSGAVALGQLPIAKLVEGRRRLRGLALMGLVWAATFLAVMAGGGWLTGTQAAVVFGVAVAVFALGECLHGAIYAPLVVDLAQPRILGRYMAFSSASWQIGWLVGPAAGGFALQHEPLALWPGAAAICLAASGYALWLERLIPTQLRLTPHVDSLVGVPGT